MTTRARARVDSTSNRRRTTGDFWNLLHHVARERLPDQTIAEARQRHAELRQRLWERANLEGLTESVNPPQPHDRGDVLDLMVHVQPVTPRPDERGCKESMFRFQNLRPLIAPVLAAAMASIVTLFATQPFTSDDGGGRPSGLSTVAATITGGATVTVTPTRPPRPTPTPAPPYIPAHLDLSLSAMHPSEGWAEGLFDVAHVGEQAGIGATLKPCSAPQTLEIRPPRRATRLQFELGQSNAADSAQRALTVAIYLNGKLSNRRSVEADRIVSFDLSIARAQAIKISLQLLQQTTACAKESVEAVVMNPRLK